jgi:hypothetical protein
MGNIGHFESASPGTGQVSLRIDQQRSSLF